MSAYSQRLVLALTLVAAATGCTSNGHDTSQDVTEASDSVIQDVAEDSPSPADTIADEVSPQDDTMPGDEDVSPDVVHLPETAVAEQAQWLIELINAMAEGGDLTQDTYEAHFASEFVANYTVTEVKSQFLNALKNRYAPLAVTGWEDTATDTAMWVRIHAAGNSKGMRLLVRLSDEAPHLINGLSEQDSPDLDPAYGPIDNTLVGFFLQDPYTAKSTSGLAVELVNRNTGLPFDPPVTGIADDKYGYVRLAIPTGVVEAGVKVTHSDGQVTYNYGKALRPGGDFLWVAAYPATAFSHYMEPFDLEPVTGKAQLWGYLYYQGPANRWSVEPHNWGVGCATITSTPVLGRIYYTRPPNYTPNAAATSTPLQNSTWYAFNVDPVQHTFTAQAEGTPLPVSVPALVADAITAVFMVFERADYLTNPTVVGCGN